MGCTQTDTEIQTQVKFNACSHNTNSIHDAASYLAFICRVRIRVRIRVRVCFRSCPVYPLAPPRTLITLHANTYYTCGTEYNLTVQVWSNY